MCRSVPWKLNTVATQHGSNVQPWDACLSC